MLSSSCRKFSTRNYSRMYIEASKVGHISRSKNTGFKKTEKVTMYIWVEFGMITCVHMSHAFFGRMRSRRRRRDNFLMCNNLATSVLRTTFSVLKTLNSSIKCKRQSAATERSRRHPHDRNHHQSNPASTTTHGKQRRRSTKPPRAASQPSTARGTVAGRLARAAW